MPKRSDMFPESFKDTREELHTKGSNKVFLQ